MAHVESNFRDLFVGSSPFGKGCWVIGVCRWIPFIHILPTPLLKGWGFCTRNSWLKMAMMNFIHQHFFLVRAGR